jgi:REP element-mobilizing transposase RayT
MFSDPVTYFITWTCYGTWLPGDDRGWTKWRKGQEIAQPLLADWCREHLVEKPVLLNAEQRVIVNDTILKHCQLKVWKLHAVNCRSNHCHTVVTAMDHDGEQVRDQFKSWCARAMKAHQREHKTEDELVREHWWTRKGSVRYLFDEESLEASIRYTLESQESGGSKLDC